VTESDFNIAIDGPASSGKGTVARLVAEDLGFRYIDTGAMFRSVALEASLRNIDVVDEVALCEIINTMTFDFEWSKGDFRIFTNGRDVTDAIRSETIGAMASSVSLHLPVRAQLLRQQQELAIQGRMVMDGRDIGSIVLPNAKLKIYLDASAAERGRRRMLDLQKRDIEADFNSLVREIEARDQQDKTRRHAPLIQADDAIYIDSTTLTASQAAQRIVDLARSRA
jgi:cytidylate kinase